MKTFGKQGPGKRADEVEAYYQVKREIGNQYEEKTKELQELLIRQQAKIKFLQEELDEARSQISKLEDLKSLYPLTGILNLLHLDRDEYLRQLVRDIVASGLEEISTSNSNCSFKL